MSRLFLIFLKFKLHIIFCNTFINTFNYSFKKPINNKVFRTLKSISISVLVFPTLLNKGNEQVILSKKNNKNNIGFELLINNKDKIQFNLNNYKIQVNEKLFEKNWYFINAIYNYKSGNFRRQDCYY